MEKIKNFKSCCGKKLRVIVEKIRGVVEKIRVFVVKIRVLVEKKRVDVSVHILTLLLLLYLSFICAHILTRKAHTRTRKHTQTHTHTHTKVTIPVGDHFCDERHSSRYALCSSNKLTKPCAQKSPTLCVGLN